MVKSAIGHMKGVIQIAPVKSGTSQAGWPEANVLIPADPVSRAPNYIAKVWIEKPYDGCKNYRCEVATLPNHERKAVS